MRCLHQCTEFLQIPLLGIDVIQEDLDGFLLFGWQLNYAAQLSCGSYGKMQLQRRAHRTVIVFAEVHIVDEAPQALERILLQSSQFLLKSRIGEQLLVERDQRRNYLPALHEFARRKKAITQLKIATDVARGRGALSSMHFHQQVAQPEFDLLGAALQLVCFLNEAFRCVKPRERPRMFARKRANSLDEF